ncbi:undecaprenyl/decaprenyl-phosphate alpha-N-acetylglucosaminyl 1-phosphate transferase [Dactylosporangium vinaceum]|uniref:Glycosyltransferase family 4 protein n=1 Tax=Dactylosporangium vinaceum TaxID=53362 RepID=A0ABV5MR55_9ACTN|nr:MraY family glycosyltransferase [Dactylosporangium vinaceum]UAC00545.1 undecaprenyl/decaprenyl-phosphate alpha-N-acetylglucosaminyl 1-phosphate transferase [Dactylosporangium vinaceum]
MTAPVIAAVFVIAVLLSAAATEGCRRLALRLGVTDRPGGYKQHREPIPYLGGLAIVAGTLGPAAGAAVLFGAPPKLTVVAVAALVVAATGLADDVEPLGPVLRLVVETGAALLVVLAGVRLALSGVWWLDAAATVAWIVLLTNAVNLLDNMDGAAAAAVGVVALVLGLGTATLTVPLLCLAGACAGFLWHNRPPARIFMGDAGSLFLGFSLATGAVLVAPPAPLPAAATVLLVGLLPLLDTALVVISRRRAGRKWYLGGRDHTAHRLRTVGLSAGQVAGVLASGAGAAATLAVLVGAGTVTAVAGLVVWLCATTAAVTALLRVPVCAVSRAS